MIVSVRNTRDGPGRSPFLSKKGRCTRVFNLFRPPQSGWFPFGSPAGAKLFPDPGC